MIQSTNNSLSGKIADFIEINKKFHEYKETTIDPQDKALISPAEGKIVNIGSIDNQEVLDFKTQ